MGTTAQKLQAILDSKEDIRQAINDKGVTVSTEDPLDSYADKISQISGGGEPPLPPSSPLVGSVFTGATYPVTYQTDTVDNVYNYKSEDYNITITGLDSVATITGNGTKDVTVTFATTSTTDAITLFNIQIVKESEIYNFMCRFFYYGTEVATGNALTVVSLIEPDSGAGTLGTNFNFVEGSLPVFSSNTSSWNTYFSHQIVGFIFGKFSSANVSINFLFTARAFNQPLTIPSSVTSIGDSFLANNSAFNQPLTIPSGVTTIGARFLQSATAFNQPLTIPSGVTSIGDDFLNFASAFNQPLTIPSSVTSIGVQFLQSATAFNQPLTIPSGLTSIAGSLLYNASAFNQPLTIPSGVTTIVSNFLQNATAFNQPLTISNNVTTIGASFLSGANFFNQPLTIPSSVTSIGISFLLNTYSLTRLIYNTTTMPATSNNNLSQNINTKTSSTGTGIAVNCDPLVSVPFKIALPDRTVSPFRKLVFPNGGKNVSSIGTNLTVTATNNLFDRQVMNFTGATTSMFALENIADLAFDNGDYTIEWFARQTSFTSPQFQRIFSIGTFPSATLAVSLESFNNGTFNLFANGTAIITIPNMGIINSWVHWAIVRESGTTRVYRNGIQVGSTTASYSISDLTTFLRVGNEGTLTAGSSFIGQLTNIRWIPGLAVYSGTNTGSANFTVPTSNLKAVSAANPYGGSNTAAVPAGATKIMIAF
jgi:hypothetical protein